MAARISTFSLDEVTVRKLNWLVSNAKIKQTKSGLLCDLIAKCYLEKKREDNIEELA